MKNFGTSFHRRILREEIGSAAIEYAVIAGLIGLGIVGSLMTTKGSLNAIFGTASSQVGASTTDSSTAVSSSPRTPFWQAKTLVGTPTSVSNPSGSSTKYRYVYSDGTTVEYEDQPGNNQIVTVMDPTRRRQDLTIMNDSGAILSTFIRFYDAGMSNIVSAISVSTVQFDGNKVPTSQNNLNYSNGNPTTENNYRPVSADTILSSSNGISDVKYFQDVSRKR